MQEHHYMNTQTQEHRNYGFAIGLMTGTFVGAGLSMWLAPRSTSELRERIAVSARTLRDRASQQYRQVSARERYAMAAKSDRSMNARTA
jgi:gas vesicle protein